jgi:hypothetical protein
MLLPVRPRKIFHAPCNFCEMAVPPGSPFSPDFGRPEEGVRRLGKIYGLFELFPAVVLPLAVPWH